MKLYRFKLPLKDSYGPYGSFWYYETTYKPSIFDAKQRRAGEIVLHCEVGPALEDGLGIYGSISWYLSDKCFASTDTR